MDFQITWLLGNHWVAGIGNLYMPISLVSRTLANVWQVSPSSGSVVPLALTTDNKKREDCCAVSSCHSSLPSRVAAAHDLAPETATTTVCVHDARDLNDIAVCKQCDRRSVVEFQIGSVAGQVGVNQGRSVLNRHCHLFHL